MKFDFLCKKKVIWCGAAALSSMTMIGGCFSGSGSRISADDGAEKTYECVVGSVSEIPSTGAKLRLLAANPATSDKLFTLKLACDDNKEHEAMVDNSKKVYKKDDKVKCKVTPETDGKTNIWTCDEGAFSFTAAVDSTMDKPLTSPEGTTTPAATTTPTATTTPAATTTPPAATTTPAGPVADAPAAPAGDSGGTTDCRGYNNDGLRCDAIGASEGQETCKWNQKWRCENGCARWISASCGGLGGPWWGGGNASGGGGGSPWGGGGGGVDANGRRCGGGGSPWGGGWGCSDGSWGWW
ncbi:MAG: hypothetical protein HQK54_17625 [Oligoflexales bacterium]|nr:hypothetical protein [Oligoflexales bacterium]